MNMADQPAAPADSRDMYVVHNMLRRAFGEPPSPRLHSLSSTP